MMTNGYKKTITEAIKDNMNNWIDKLKEEHKALLLTKQWQILFPKGFNAGHNVLPVVTGSKKGKHMVAEVQFVLPTSLELDFNDIELILKNEPFKVSKTKKKKKPVPLDEPIDILNNLVTGVNSFLESLNIPIPSTPTFTGFTPTETQQSPLRMQPLLSTAIHPSHPETTPPLNTDNNMIEKIKDEMLKSPHLPEWIKTIESREVWNGLMQKLSEGFIHYQKKLGKAVDLKEFFQKYEKHLKDKGKLHYFCKYKSKPVNLDDNQWCHESYCSKMPYRSKCSYATLRFGVAENG